MVKIYKFNKKNILLLFFFICVIAYLTLSNVRDLDQILVINDEFGYWGNAAQLAGKKWDTLMGATPYYSYGYSLFLVPLYWFVKVPSVMYAASIVFNFILLLISFICGIYITKNINKKVTDTSAIFLSFINMLYINNLVQSQTAWSETLLYCLVMLCVCVLIYTLKTNSFLGYMFIVIIAMYSYIVHQRSIVLLISIAGVFFLLIVNKKLSLKTFFKITFVIGILVVIQLLMKKQIMQIHQDNSLADINDYSGQIGKLQMLLSFEGVWQIIKNCFGELFYISVSSYCIVPLGIIVSIRKAFVLLKEEKKTKIHSCNFYLFCFLILSFIGAVLLSAIFIFEPTRIDMVVYGRYIDYLIGPLMLIGLGQIVDNSRFMKNILIVVCANIVLALFLQRELIKFSVDTYNAFGSAGVCKYFFNNPDVNNIILNMVITSVTVFCVVYFICTRKTKITALLIACSLSFVGLLWIKQYNQYEDFVIFRMQEENRNYVKPIANYLLDKNAKNITFIYDSSDEEAFKNEIENGKVKYFQFLLPDREIKYSSYKDIENVSGYLLVDNNSSIHNLMCDNYVIEIETETFTLLKNISLGE